jgi:hypothetical protein
MNNKEIKNIEKTRNIRKISGELKLDWRSKKVFLAELFKKYRDVININGKKNASLSL